MYFRDRTLAGLAVSGVSALARLLEIRVQWFRPVLVLFSVIMLAGFFGGVGHVGIRWEGFMYPMIFFLGFVVVVTPPFALLLAIRVRTAERTRESGGIESTIGVLTEALKKDPEDLDTHVHLARLYEHRKAYAEAAEEYRAALRLASAEEFGLKKSLEYSEGLMRRMFAIDQEKRTFVCPGCENRCRPSQRRCDLCGKPLYANAAEWAWSNTPLLARVAAVLVAAISVLYLVWLPPLLCFILGVVWLVAVANLSIPWEGLATA
jgi:hypothetical protein